MAAYPRTLQLFLGAVATAAEDEDGKRLASLMHFFPVPRERAEWLRKARSADLEEAISRRLDAPFDEMVYAFLQTAQLLESGQLSAAFQLQVTYCNMMLGSMGEWERWCVPLICTATADLRQVAALADKAAGTNECLNDTSRIVLKFFNICATDRAPLETSKKWGTLYIANVAFRIFYFLKQPRMLPSIFRVLNLPGFPLLEFPQSQIVTLKYYSGLTSFYEEQYEKAHEDFMYAFQHCPRNAIKNKRTLLLYLIPTRLIIGRSMSKGLLRKYNMNIYTAIMQCVRQGNLGGLRAAVESRRDTFARLRLLLAMERIELNCIRSLLRKTHVLTGTAARLPLANVSTAFAVAGEQLGDEEVEAIVARLIDMGWVRGYIAKEKQLIVLSQANPFPGAVNPL